MNLDTDPNIFKIINGYLSFEDSIPLSKVSMKTRKYWKQFGCGELYNIENLGRTGMFTALSFRPHNSNVTEGSFTYITANYSKINFYIK